MSWPSTQVLVPKLQLVGFERVPIRVNSEERMEFMITSQNLAVWIDDSSGWGIINGILLFSAFFKCLAFYVAILKLLQ